MAAYVERLKDQLQTAERTFKSRIAELSCERDKMKAENSELASRLKMFEAETGENHAEGIKGGEAPGPDPAELIRIADESVAEMRGRIGELEAELAEARGLKERLSEEEGSLRDSLDDLRAQLDAESAEHDRLLNEAHRQNRELSGQADVLARANAGLTDQLEASKRNILESLAEKDALAEVNEQLREALNGLIVKAGAAVQENGELNALLSAEREQLQRYRALWESMGDSLARVRTAGRMLDERVIEMGNTLNWGAGQASKPPSGSHGKTKAELMDFTEGKGPAVRELIDELKGIQGGLSQ